jgi:hypothetical protein
MGATYSTIPGASEEQKKRYGVFSLRTKQNQTLILLNDLITELMSDSNIMSLMSLYKSGSTMDCTKMFLVLSTTLKKEFQVLKFPDPDRPSEIAELAYLPKSVYDEKFTKDNKRAALCEQIAWFIVRFTTLIFALVSSLKISKTMKFEGAINKIFVPKVSDIELKFDITKINGYGYMTLNSNLMFIKSNEVLIDKKQSIVFNGNATETGVARITFGPKRVRKTQTAIPQPQFQVSATENYAKQVERVQQVQAQLQAQQQKEESIIKEDEFIVTLYSCDAATNTCIQPTETIGYATTGVQTTSTGVGPNAGSNTGSNAGSNTGSNTGSNAGSKGSNGASSGIGIGLGGTASVATSGQQIGGKRRSTRKYRNVRRRKTYKFVGGALPVGAFEFTLRTDGMTYTADNPSSLLSFNERVTNLLNSFANKYKGSENPFYPLDNITSSVKNRIERISEVLKSVDENTSPAQYRSYLLATSTATNNGKPLLNTAFCIDEWADKPVTTILSYALLDALFKDIKGNESKTTTTFEYQKIVDQFVIRNIMKPVVESKAPTSFNELKFSKANEELADLCKRPEFVISNTVSIETLTNAHKSIRDLYDSHMQAVVQFITQKLITPKLMGYRQQPKWILNPGFSTDEHGSVELLESLIQEARTMLVKHYFAVESIYITTLQKLKGAGLGLEPESIVNTGALLSK